MINTPSLANKNLLQSGMLQLNQHGPRHRVWPEAVCGEPPCRHPRTDLLDVPGLDGLNIKHQSCFVFGSLLFFIFTAFPKTMLRGSRTISSKQGNKNFYKGSRGGKLGRFTNAGRFVVETWKLRTFVAPLFVAGLTPYVSPKAPFVRREHSVLQSSSRCAATSARRTRQIWTLQKK